MKNHWTSTIDMFLVMLVIAITHAKIAKILHVKN